MNQLVRIDSRFATAEETAQILGISSLHREQIVKLFEVGKKKPRATKKRSAALRANRHTKAGYASPKKSRHAKTSKAAR